MATVNFSEIHAFGRLHVIEKSLLRISIAPVSISCYFLYEPQAKRWRSSSLDEELTLITPGLGLGNSRRYLLASADRAPSRRL